MLAAMATVTSGLLSPNSYALNPDPVAATMTGPETSDYVYSGGGGGGGSTGSTFCSGAASSDSEPEGHVAAPKDDCGAPKRNKRKNFLPRCANAAYPPDATPIALTAFTNNNNNNHLMGSGVRRRKTLATRKVLVDARTSSPIDLSKTNDSNDSASDDSDDYHEEGEPYLTENDKEEADNDEGDSSGSDRSKIPSSFSIHTLAKPHVSDAGLLPGQVSEMREYAVNTMRELLGIYGLTSEVAESISRQLPIAAFSSGNILEKLSLGLAQPRAAGGGALVNSQPLTPPRTPHTTDPHPHPHPPHKSPITSSPSPSPTTTTTATIKSLMAHCPKGPLDLDMKSKRTSSGSVVTANVATPYINGGANFGLLAAAQMELEARSRLADVRVHQGHSPRISFSGSLLPFSSTTSEGDSPPPMESSPLNAMMAQSLAPTQLRDNQQQNLKTQTQLDYSKYVKRFASSLECGTTYCKDLNYREHFHCLDCNSRVFIKKEEMIRHFKWHKKRDESLQHGFMRYSPLDDCSDRFAGCSHNKKQTHYHCIKEGCDKVYISTSDVQMHANYHRKDSAIIQEGFQRYRATEECGATYCSFFGQRTTHFHCRRSGCRFTFKNKSDMEKHKSYHIKDEQLSRDGFKKFMKSEVCPYENCRFSRVCNHIHCIRPQCNYVLHSSGQLFSHKRKHERKDSELAYRKYKLAQSMMKTLQDSGMSIAFPRDLDQFESLTYQQQNSTSNMSNTESLSDRNSPVSYDENESFAMDLSANDSNFALSDDAIQWNGEDFWKKYCEFHGAQDVCVDNCEHSFTDHYHCMMERCDTVFKDGAREHARNHEQQEQITDAFFTTVAPQSGSCEEGCIYQDKEKHYHCNWDNCREIILPTDKPFRRLEHYKMHEYSRKLSLTKDPLTMTHLATSIDGMFCRKRGRPPKNRVIEVWNDYSPLGSQSLMDSPQAIFTSFKLPKPSSCPTSSTKDLEQQQPSPDSRSNSPPSDFPLMQGFDVYGENTKCSDSLCPYLGNVHFHCNQHRCLYVTDKEDVLVMHSKDFHDNIEILDGFEFYDRNVDCRLSSCASNKVNRHFHCTRPNCNYSFIQYSTMAIHNQKHVEEAAGALETTTVKLEPGEKIDEDQYRAMNLSQIDNKISVVKASGTFYPLSTIPIEMHTPEMSKSLPADMHNGVQEIHVPDMGSQTLYGPETSCSRPFCKLKRKYHYHCNACNQAFSEVDRLLSHIAKHSTGALNSQLQDDPVPSPSSSHAPPTPPNKLDAKINVAPLHALQNPSTKSEPPDAQAPPPPPTYLTPTFDAYTHFGNFPANLATQFALMSQQQAAAFLPQGLYQNAQLMFQHPALMQGPLLAPPPPPPPPTQPGYNAENMTSPLAAMAANINKRSMSPHELSPEQKKARLQSSMRILKDEPVPEGYLRFRFNEDCQYSHCGYREHQTHFHCQRQDCGYSFCDKTRFVQHTARHERLDTLMGGDFQQYRANVPCGRPDCAYTTNLGSSQNKASHFHCLKCEFVCTDTNKVVAHRRQHQKLDSIQAAGFEKFTPSQQCKVINCQHSGKQTHYHCLQCHYAVLGLAQMSAHKYRHMDG